MRIYTIINIALGIHNGENTHHHDQSICSVTLSNTNKIVNNVEPHPPNEMVHPGLFSIIKIKNFISWVIIFIYITNISQHSITYSS